MAMCVKELVAPLTVCGVTLITIGKQLLSPGMGDFDRSPEPGWRHLALPAALCAGEESLTAWDAFEHRYSVMAPLEEITVAVEPDPESVSDEESEYCRFRFGGLIDQGGSQLILVFDSLSQRWLRLRPGQPDNESAVSLRYGAGGLLLHDSYNSRYYSFVMEKQEFIPVVIDDYKKL